MDLLWKSCGKVGDFSGKLGGFDRGSDDDGVAVVVFFDLVGGVARDGDELVGFLGGGVVGFAEGLDEELETEADERIEGAEAGVFDILVV